MFLMILMMIFISIVCPLNLEKLLKLDWISTHNKTDLINGSFFVFFLYPSIGNYFTGVVLILSSLDRILKTKLKTVGFFIFNLDNS